MSKSADGREYSMADLQMLEIDGGNEVLGTLLEKCSSTSSLLGSAEILDLKSEVSPTEVQHPLVRIFLLVQV